MCGKLADRAREKSPYIRLGIGEQTPPLVYKGWKEITNQWGESFRYTFDIETENGFIQKTWDCALGYIAEALDAIPYGTQVIIKREPKVIDGQIIPEKSVYKIEKFNFDLGDPPEEV